MKNFDTHEDILGYNFSQPNKGLNKSDLTIPENNLKQLVLAYGDDSLFGLSIRELVRVYELVREEKVK